MSLPTSRRQFLHASTIASATLAALPATAFDLPRFDDLRPKWEQVAMGDTPEQVVLRMGNPNRRSEQQLMGVVRLDLVWKDIRSQQYTARFLAGRLYAKDMTDNP